MRERTETSLQTVARPWNNAGDVFSFFFDATLDPGQFLHFHHDNRHLPCSLVPSYASRGSSARSVDVFKQIHSPRWQITYLTHVKQPVVVFQSDIIPSNQQWLGEAHHHSDCTLLIWTTTKINVIQNRCINRLLNQNRLSYLSEVCLIKSFNQLNNPDHSQIVSVSTSQAFSFSKCSNHSPHEFIGIGLWALLLGLQLQQGVDPLHAQVVLVILEGREGVL